MLMHVYLYNHTVRAVSWELYNIEIIIGLSILEKPDYWNYPK
jgi:hypothetical protein